MVFKLSSTYQHFYFYDISNPLISKKLHTQPVASLLRTEAKLYTENTVSSHQLLFRKLNVGFNHRASEVSRLVIFINRNTVTGLNKPGTYWWTWLTYFSAKPLDHFLLHQSTLPYKGLFFSFFIFVLRSLNEICLRFWKSSLSQWTLYSETHILSSPIVTIGHMHFRNF